MFSCTPSGATVALTPLAWSFGLQFIFDIASATDRPTDQPAKRLPLSTCNVFDSAGLYNKLIIIISFYNWLKQKKLFEEEEKKQAENT